MGKVNDIRSWILLASGWGTAVSVGLLATSIQLGERLYTYYAIAAGAFFALVFVGAGWMAASRMRRRYFMMVAIVNAGVCSFGLGTGFVLFGPALAVFVVLTGVCIARDTSRARSSRSTVQRAA
jgi:predicted permease